MVYLHSDHLGSVSVTTKADGTVAETQLYDPWGRQRAGNLAQTSLDYTGQRRDNTGLLYYHARYYDPMLGRFLQADTIVPGVGALTVAPSDKTADDLFDDGDKMSGPSNPQELNRYSYVNNNPVRYTDPTGHVPRGVRCWGCDRQWWSVNSGWGRAASQVVCFFQGCHVRGNTVHGPTTREYINSGMWLPVPMVQRGGSPAWVSRVRTVSPFRVRFSQSSINYRFKNGQTIYSMANGLRNGIIRAADIPPIRIVRRGIRWYTLDNRRLEAFRRAGVRVPYRRATKQEAVNEGWKFTTRDFGRSIRVRGE